MSHYDNTPMQYTIFKLYRMKSVHRFFIMFGKNIDCGLQVLTSTHNICFGSEIIIIGLHAPVLLYKSGF